MNREEIKKTAPAGKIKIYLRLWGAIRGEERGGKGRAKIQKRDPGSCGDSIRAGERSAC